MKKKVKLLYHKHKETLSKSMLGKKYHLQKRKIKQIKAKRIRFKENIKIKGISNLYQKLMKGKNNRFGKNSWINH